MIGQTLGSYRVLRQLGRGGMGSVWVGEHVGLGHPVAIKVLLPEIGDDPDAVQRFFNEARAAARVRDPGIVRILDFGRTDDGAPYLAMELLDGETLRARLRAHGPLPVDEAATVIRQIATTLEAAHAAGIVHRDLKPDNVMLVPDAEVRGGERIKILDFGIAKLTEERWHASVQTRTGSLLGTPHYMSPEQCRGTGEVDERADVYALGCILFELVCGRPPFVSDGVGEIVGMHQFVAPPSPRSLRADVPDWLEAVVLRCLAKDPAQRFASMAALAGALEDAIPAAARPRRASGPPGAGTGRDTPLALDATMATPASGREAVALAATMATPASQRAAATPANNRAAGAAGAVGADEAVALAATMATPASQRTAAATPETVAPTPTEDTIAEAVAASAASAPSPAATPAARIVAVAERAAPDGAAPDDLARDAQAQALALAETLARQEQARRSTPGGLTRHVTVIAVAVVVLAGLVLWIRPQMTKSAEPAYAPAGGNVGQGSTAAGGSGSGSGSTDEDPHRRVGTGNHDLLGSGAGTGTASGASAGTGGVPEHVGIPGRDAGAGGAPSAVGKPRLDGGVPRAAIDAGAPARPIDAGVPDAGPVPDGPRPIDAGLAVDASTLAQRYDRLVEDATAAFDAGDVHTALRKAEQGIRMMPDEFNAYGVALVMSCHLRDRARMKKYLRVVRQRFSDREYFLTDLCLKAGVDPTE